MLPVGCHEQGAGLVTAFNANRWFGDTAREANRGSGMRPVVRSEDKAALANAGAMLAAHEKQKRKD